MKNQYKVEVLVVILEAKMSKDKIIFLVFFGFGRPRCPNDAQSPPRGEQKATKVDRKVTKSRPKGIQRRPKESKRRPKSIQR